MHEVMTFELHRHRVLGQNTNVIAVWHGGGGGGNAQLENVLLRCDHVSGRYTDAALDMSEFPNEGMRCLLHTNNFRRIRIISVAHAYVGINNQVPG